MNFRRATLLSLALHAGGCAEPTTVPPDDTDATAEPGLVCEGDEEVLRGTVTERQECAVEGSISETCGTLSWSVTGMCGGTGPPDAALCADPEGVPYARVHESWSQDIDAAGGSEKIYDEDGRLVYVTEWMTGFGSGWTCDSVFVYGYTAGEDPHPDCSDEARAALCG